MASAREQAHRDAVVNRYGIDICTRAQSAIQVAKDAEAARHPQPPVRSSDKPAVINRVAVDTNGVPITPTLRLRQQ